MRSLAQFERVELNAGQSQTVTLHVPARQLSYWNEKTQQWVLDSGGRSLWVGDADAAASLPLKTTLNNANGNVTCSNDEINATTINGNLNVPAGSWCDLVDVTVHGNVQVTGGSGLRLAGSTVTGNVQLTGTNGAGDLMSSGANVICNTTINGNLQITGSSSSSPWHIGDCGPTRIGGNFQLTGNAGTGNTVSHTSVGGNAQCTGNHDVTGSGNTVSGIRQGQCVTL